MSRRRAWLLLASALLGGCAAFASDEDVIRGDGYRITVRGTEALTTSEASEALQNDLRDLQARGIPRPAVDDGAWTLELLLRGRGYAFATVGWELLVGTDGVPEIIYDVAEGPLVVLGNVSVQGNVALTDEELLPLFLGEGEGLFGLGDTPYVESRVAAAVASTAALYLGAGFRRAEVGPARVSFSPDRAIASVVVPVTEGLRYRVARLDISGQTAIPLPELQGEVAEFVGKPYFPQVGFSVRERLIDRLGVNGYPDAVVTYEEQSDDTTGDVVLNYDVQSGPLVAVAAVRVEGTGRTDEEFVRKRVELQPGQAWSKLAERDSYAALHRAQLFSNVHMALQPAEPAEVQAVGELPQGAEPRALVVEVTEGPQREYFIEPGYGSYEGPRLVVGYRDRNIAGQGLTLHTEAAVSAKVRRVLAGLTDPWLFPGPDISGDVSVFTGRREEPAFVRDEVGFALTLGHQFDARNSAFLVYSLRRTTVSDVELEDPTVAESEDTVDIGSLALTPVHDSRDDLFSPTRGMLARVTGEVGNSALGGELDFLRGRVETAWFWPVSQRSVLAASFRTGVIMPNADTDEIPLQERFFNGGQDTVRSFKEDELGPKDDNGNPLGGETFSVASLEWRRRLLGKLDGALFVDAGNVETDSAEYFGFHGIAYAVGIGMRYRLPVGPVRLDVGWNPWPDDDEDQYVVHLSVGMPF